MNLGDMRTRVRDLSGVRQAELSPDARLGDLLNEVYLELAGAETWPWLYVDVPTVSVAAETAIVELPAVFRIFDGVLFDGRRLRQVALAAADEANVERLGEPYVYARVGERDLRLIPTPEASGTLSVRGYRQPDRLVTPSDVPIFDSEFHHALPYAAASRLLSEEGDDSGRIEAYVEQANGVVESMRTRYLASHEALSFQMGGRSARAPRWRLR